MPCLCFKSKKDLSKVCCLPLACFALIVSAVLTAYQAWRLSDIVQSSEWGTWSSYISVTLGALQLVVVVLALVAILARWATGVALLVLGYKLVLLVFVFSFISMWVSWILAMGGWGNDTKWQPNSSEWVHMGIVTAVHIIFFIFSWVVISCVHSLKNVIAVGGTGWEYKSYKEIRTGNLGAGKSRSSSSDDSV